MKRLLFVLAVSIPMFAQGNFRSPCPGPDCDKGITITVQPTLQPEWVPEPSAGHYDCPNGWVAYSRSEPYPPVTAVNANYVPLPTDKKGHVLGVRPPEPICIQDSVRP